MPNGDSFPHRKLTPTFSSPRCGYWHHATLLFSRYAPTWGASTKPQPRVNRQLSPWRIRYSQRKQGEGGIRIGRARFRAEVVLVPPRPPSNRPRGPARTRSEEHTSE